MEQELKTRNPSLSSSSSSAAALYYSAATRSPSSASDNSPLSAPPPRIRKTHQPNQPIFPIQHNQPIFPFHPNQPVFPNQPVQPIQPNQPIFPVATPTNPSANDGSSRCRSEGRDVLSSPSERRRNCCDIYISFCGCEPHLIRFVRWLRAELELHGILCFTSTAGRRCDYKHPASHSLARRAIGQATQGVVVITKCVFSNGYIMEELGFLLQEKKLVPIFFGLGQGNCLVRDIVERRGELWEKHGGELWAVYGGLEKEWREVVDWVSSMDPKLEAHVENWRDCVLKTVAHLGKMLGRKDVVEKVERWKELVEKAEHPYPRNVNFVGRESELLDLKLILFGDVDGEEEDKSSELRADLRCRRNPMRERRTVGGEQVAIRPIDRKAKGKEPFFWKETKEEIEMEGVFSGEEPYWFPREMGVARQGRRRRRSVEMQFGEGIACISGDSGIGKTELLLEFAYKFSKSYKMVLWVGGEARYFRQNYLNLFPFLGVDVSIESEPERNEMRSFEQLEEQAIRRVKKELMKGIPFLVVIDNLEGEIDWWDGRNIMELLPGFGGETHIIISTRLPRVMNLEPLKLFYLSGAEAMSLMKGNSRDLPTEEVYALRAIEEKLGRVTLGLALVGALLIELPISPQKLLDAINQMPHRDLTWSGREDVVLRRNPFLVQLFDFCLSIFDLSYKSKNLTSRMVQASGWFAPSPIPVNLLISAASEISEECYGTSFWKKCLGRVTCMCVPSHTNGSEMEALGTLVRLQIARSSTKDGFINFHDIIKLYARRRGDVSIAHAMVSVISTKGSLRHHAEHLWAACFLLFKFGTDHAVVSLKIPDLVSFIKSFVFPLAMDTFTVFSRCKAALELLRLSTEAMETIEESFLSEANQALQRPVCWTSSTDQSTSLFNTFLHKDFDILRATLLETRAKLMLRGGMYDIGEQLCKKAINIKEVIYGWEHPETVSTIETMGRLRRLQTKF